MQGRSVAKERGASLKLKLQLALAFAGFAFHVSSFSNLLVKPGGTKHEIQSEGRGDAVT